MAWIVLFLAGLLEIGWAVGLKQSAGFTRFWPSVITVVSMLFSIGLLGVAMKSLPLGTAYAVRVGIGAVGTVLAGMIFMGESTSLLRSVSLLLIILGIAGLKMSTPP